MPYFKNREKARKRARVVYIQGHMALAHKKARPRSRRRLAWVGQCFCLGSLRLHRTGAKAFAEANAMPDSITFFTMAPFYAVKMGPKVADVPFHISGIGGVLLAVFMGGDMRLKWVPCYENL
jgi:hypothetical protein